MSRQIDERAKDVFRLGFVGKSHGDNGTAYKQIFDTQCGLPATKMFKDTCAYCGETGLPLQPFIPYGNYEVKGRMCVCKSAMDEHDHKKAVAAMEKRHREERQQLEAAAPKYSQGVLDRVVEQEQKRRGNDTGYLKTLGITL